MNIRSKTYLTILIIILLLFTLLNFTSCDNGPINPNDKPSLKDYRWEVDTLNIPDAFQNFMYSIWGSNSDDVYLVGHNSGSQIYAGDGNMWHYDGENWEVVRLRASMGGFALRDIHGSSAQNIWAVGYRQTYGDYFTRAYFMQFNGISWSEHLVKTNNTVNSILVLSENNVWACGDGGIIYHFNGSNWDLDTITSNTSLLPKVVLNNLVGDENSVYLIATLSSENTYEEKYQIIKYSEGAWIIEDSSSSSSSFHPFGITTLYYSGDKSLYSIGPNIKKRNGNWETIPLITTSWIREIYGESNNHMVALSLHEVFHFNGSNWQEINTLRNNDIVYWTLWLNHESVFVVGHLLNKTVVWNGK